LGSCCHRNARRYDFGFCLRRMRMRRLLFGEANSGLSGKAISETGSIPPDGHCWQDLPPPPSGLRMRVSITQPESKTKRGPNPNSRKCKKGTRNLTKKFRKRDPLGLERGYLWGPNRDRRLGCPHEEKAARKPSLRRVLCPLIGENRSPMLRGATCLGATACPRIQP